MPPPAAGGSGPRIDSLTGSSSIRLLTVCLVCDRARSLPLKALRSLAGSSPEPFPATRWTRAALPRPPAPQRSARPRARVARSFAAYDRAMERRARAMGMEEPVVITTQPLLAGFAELSWARRGHLLRPRRLGRPPRLPPLVGRLRRELRADPSSRQACRGRLRAAARAPLPGRPGGGRGKRTRTRRVDRPAPALRSSSAGSPTALCLSTQGRSTRAWTSAGSNRRRASCATRPSCWWDRLSSPTTCVRWSPIENVRIHPELGREELAGLIRSADVGLIPHRRTPLTEAMSPLKLYEYLAGGLPVLASSSLLLMRGIGPRVVLVEEGADFGACLRVALALGRADEETRLGFVAENSWRSRHDELLELALAR